MTQEYRLVIDIDIDDQDCGPHAQRPRGRCSPAAVARPVFLTPEWTHIQAKQA